MEKYSFPSFELIDSQNRVFLFSLISGPGLKRFVETQKQVIPGETNSPFTPACYKIRNSNTTDLFDLEMLRDPESALLQKNSSFKFDFRSEEHLYDFIKTYGVSYSIDNDGETLLICFLLYQSDESDYDEVRDSYFSSFSYKIFGDEQNQKIQLAAKIETWEQTGEEDWDFFSRPYKAIFNFPFSKQTINDLILENERFVSIESVSDYLNEIYEIYGYLYTTYLVEIEAAFRSLSPSSGSIKPGADRKLESCKNKMKELDAKARIVFDANYQKTHGDLAFFRECLSETVSLYSEACSCFPDRHAPEMDVPARRSQTLFFRGDSLPYYDLLPAVFRNQSFKKNENKMINDFCSASGISFQKMDHFEQLSIMQHHSLPTRFLDISKNPLVALYMCCRKESDWNQVGEVSVFAPSFLSFENQCPNFGDETLEVLSSIAFLEYEDKKAIEKILHSPFSKNDDAIRQFVKGETSGEEMNKIGEDKLPWPRFRESWKKLTNLVKEKRPSYQGWIPLEQLTACFFASAPVDDPRVRAQSGHFLLSGFDFQKSCQRIAQSKETNTFPRIIVKNKQEILQQLKILDISDATMFPDADHLARQISDEYAGGRGFNNND